MKNDFTSQMVAKLHHDCLSRLLYVSIIYFHESLKVTLQPLCGIFCCLQDDHVININLLFWKKKGRLGPRNKRFSLSDLTTHGYFLLYNSVVLKLIPLSLSMMTDLPTV